MVLLSALTGATTCLIWKHIFLNAHLSWTDAQAYCRKNYVDLSTIDSQEELNRFKKCCRRSAFCPKLDRTEQDTRSDLLWSVVWWKCIWIHWMGEPDFLGAQHCVSICNAEFSSSNCPNNLPFICYTWQPTLIMVQEIKTWTEALVHRYLISLSSKTDFLQVNKIIGNFDNASVWTGLNFLDASWFWVDNEPLRKPVSLPSCPVRHFRCGAKVGVDILENRDCMEKMRFICYQRQGYVC